MISRFYDPTTGTISLDGRDIRSIPLNEYRSHIALVSQDAVLYEVSPELKSLQSVLYSLDLIGNIPGEYYYGRNYDLAGGA